MRYPLFLDLSGRRVLVVGAGGVAARRVARLLECGATVEVVAPALVGDLPEHAVTLHRRGFEPSDVEGCALVLACTDDPAVNAAVADAAERSGIWCVRADDAASSAAWVPALATVDDVQVAVSAGGDPGRAVSVRDAAARSLQSGEWPARRTRRGQQGRVTLVGGGPGDPELLTVGGLRALLDADVVVADRLGPTDLLAQLPAEVEVVDVGKDPRGHATAQEEINALLVERARAGQDVVRLKGGDPFVLGRGSEEVRACTAEGIAVRVIPGVSSATAAPTLAGVPLTERGTAQEFTVVSGHVPPGDPRSSVDWDRLGGGRGTLVLLMAVANLDAIASALIAAGREPATPAVLVENASMPGQRVVRSSLRRLAASAQEAGVIPPAVVVIGAVVSSATGADAERP